MSEEEINIAIAEYRGWQILEPEVHRAITYHWAIEPDGSKSILPDYCNDLNLIHEAEKVLTSEQVTSYVYSLELMNERWATPAFATASQRAKAFVETIGKWKE